MIRSLLVVSAAFSINAAVGQNTIRIQISQLPAYHAAGSDIYMAGSFNGWNPQDQQYRFQRDAQGNYFLDLKLDDGSYEYKLTRGGWDKVECAKDGASIQNRLVKLPAISPTNIAVEEWADRFPAQAPRKSTASANVQIIDTAFLIPQLNRTRRIWIYLPDGYETSNKRYPVLYMHDGQNVFDDATSFSGEWGVDEFLDSTKAPQSIVVGVDNGGSRRMNEYNPYDNKRFGKAEGDAYVDFLVQTLKPFIDKKYRTLKDKANTSIAGSSMGGLISMYAVLKYPKTFGKVGVFSPAFWISGDGIFKDIRSKGGKVSSSIYFYGGKLEGETMVPDMTKAYDEMKKVSKSKMKLVVREDGLHNEPTWKQEFPGFYKF